MAVFLYLRNYARSFTKNKSLRKPHITTLVCRSNMFILFPVQYIDSIALDAVNYKGPHPEKEIHIFDKESVTVICMASAVSAMFNLSYRWSLNDMVIDSSSHFTIKDSNESSNLTISNITHADAGKIICTY